MHLLVRQEKGLALVPYDPGEKIVLKMKSLGFSDWF